MCLVLFLHCFDVCYQIQIISSHLKQIPWLLPLSVGALGMETQWASELISRNSSELLKLLSLIKIGNTSSFWARAVKGLLRGITSSYEPMMTAMIMFRRTKNTMRKKLHEIQIIVIIIQHWILKINPHRDFFDTFPVIFMVLPLSQDPQCKAASYMAFTSLLVSHSIGEGTSLRSHVLALSYRGIGTLWRGFESEPRSLCTW